MFRYDNILLLMFFSAWWWFPHKVLAQESSDPVAVEEQGSTDGSTSDTPTEKADTDNILDEAPLVSPRAAGMGEAISTLADNVDAIYYNPAGIGGLNWGKEKPPLIRKFYFPFLGAAANKNAQDLNSDFKKENASGDKTIGSAVMQAHAGKREYGRATVATGMVFGRFIVLPFDDQQIAAVSLGGESDLVKTHYREMSGVAMGGSICDPNGTLYLGWSSVLASRREVLGDIAYQDMAVKSTRSKALGEHEISYSGTANNVGAIWVINPKYRPTLSFVDRNMGGTSYTASGHDNLKIEEDMTLGFSFSPNVGKKGVVNFILEEGHLTNEDISLEQKFRLGLEYLWGGKGSFATLGARTGYNSAGVSFGVTLNLGLVALEGASQAVDIGVDNRKIPERRTVATFIVNVAEF